VTEEDVLEFLAKRSTKPLKTKDLARGLNVPSHQYGELRDLLHQMVERGSVYRVKGQRYALPDKLNLVVGRLQVVKSGAGFVVPEDKSHADVFVPAHKLGTAVHGDRVVVRVEKHPPDSNSEGSIIKVLERARQQLVGTFRRSRHFGFVKPDDRKLTFDVYVSPDSGLRPQEGQKVLVRIDDWGEAGKSPEGTVAQILGFPDETGVDVLSIIHDHGLNPEFPPEVERAAAALPRRIPQQEIERRLDLRGRLCFTIDPVNARDFDDALSIEAVGKGGEDWEVGIHIADVGYYLDPDGPLDLEGRRRATSVYLVDRVIPMLPEALSNHLCSLNPDEDKLAFSVLVTLDRSGEIQASRIVETVIRSRARLTYQEAQQLLDAERPTERPRELGEAVRLLRDLSRELRRKRATRGSLDFDLPEAEVVLDEEGFPLDILETVRLDSNRLIEEFMLLANEIVARRAQKRNVPFVYRVHEEPDPLKIENLRRFAAVFGYAIPPGDVTPLVLQRVLQRAEGTREEQLLNTVVLRSMKQARYSVDNIGHFGLASDCYTHFTSPIRRYPDVLVHRNLKSLDREAARPEAEKDEERKHLARLAEHASAQERVAQEAERDSIDLKKVEFMERHLGETFEGTISGVQAFGFFVRLQRHFVEGLVHVNSLDDDYYMFVEQRYSLVGQHTGRTFRLGDVVSVQVARVDKEARQIDFLLASGGAGRPRVGGRPRRESAPARDPGTRRGRAPAGSAVPSRASSAPASSPRPTAPGPATDGERSRQERGRGGERRRRGPARRSGAPQGFARGGSPAPQGESGARSSGRPAGGRPGRDAGRPGRSRSGGKRGPGRGGARGGRGRS
jgi:ribonuclease R